MASAAIRPKFSTHVRTAGDRVEGHVEIDLRLAQKEKLEMVRVKLRGKSMSKIRSSNGQTSSTNRETVPLITQDHILWSRSRDLTTFSSNPNSHVVSLPFSFHLADNLPPSFYKPGHSKSAKIGYGVEIIGERPGLFRSNRRIPFMFGLRPKGDGSSIAIRSGLADDGLSWNGYWKVYQQHESLRTGMFSGNAGGNFKLSLPDVPSLPMRTPIPFRMSIATSTKQVKKAQVPELSNPYDPSAKDAVFPSISANPGAFSISLGYNLEITVKAGWRTLDRQSGDSDLVLLAGGRGSYIPRDRDVEQDNKTRPIGEETVFIKTETSRPIKMRVSEPQWKPSVRKEGEKGEVQKGTWKREISFEGVFELPQRAPSFRTKNIAYTYFLNVKVPFPGIGNDITRKIPITVSDALWPDGGYDYTTPPPDLELPPAYFNDHEDWNSDEKN